MNALGWIVLGGGGAVGAVWAYADNGSADPIAGLVRAIIGAFIGAFAAFAYFVGGYTVVNGLAGELAGVAQVVLYVGVGCITVAGLAFLVALVLPDRFESLADLFAGVAMVFVVPGALLIFYTVVAAVFWSSP